VNDVFYKFVPNITANYEITTCGSADVLNTVLSVHGGSCGTIANNPPLACNNDSDVPVGNIPCVNGVHSRIASVSLVAGNTYYIRVAKTLPSNGIGNHVFNLNIAVVEQGPCCDAAGACTLTTAAACTGEFQGTQRVCETSPCPLGACCDALGGC